VANHIAREVEPFQLRQSPNKQSLREHRRTLVTKKPGLKVPTNSAQ
jgi:hypothetical protein